MEIIIILLITAITGLVIIFQSSHSKTLRRIRQLEHNLQNLEDHTEDFRQRYNDNKKVPPKIPNDQLHSY